MLRLEQRRLKMDLSKNHLLRDTSIPTHDDSLPQKTDCPRTFCTQNATKAQTCFSALIVGGARVSQGGSIEYIRICVSQFLQELLGMEWAQLYRNFMWAMATKARHPCFGHYALLGLVQIFVFQKSILTTHRGFLSSKTSPRRPQDAPEMPPRRDFGAFWEAT